MDPLATFNGRTRFFNQDVIQRLLQAVVLRLSVIDRPMGIRWPVKEPRKIQAPCLPVGHAFARIEKISAPNQIVKPRDAELGHDLPNFFSDKEKVIHDMLWPTGEFLTQHWILGGNAHRAGIQMAFTHHDAALHHQRCGCEPKLIGTQQRTNHHVAAGLHLTIGLHTNPAAQPV